MENIKAHLDLFLTEISIELLGNKIYDVNGKRQDKLINLFKALPLEEQKNCEKNDNNSESFSCLAYRSDSTNNESSLKEFLNDQIDYILKNANSSSKVNQEIIKCLKDYKADQRRLLADVSDMNLKKVIERSKVTVQLNKARYKISTEQRSRPDDIREYYEREKNDLLKMSMDTLRLMKYILNDPNNEDIKGEMIGFVHAMRSVKDLDVISKSNRDVIRPMPYQLPKERRSITQPSAKTST